MKANDKISFYPLFEIIIFLIFLIGSSVLYFYIKVNIWICLILSVYAYFLTVAKSCIIKISDTEFKITFLNPIVTKYSIPFEKITKINSSQSFDREIVITGELYTLFSNKYVLQYLDKNSKTKSIIFSISNKNKEALILSELQSQSGERL